MYPSRSSKRQVTPLSERPSSVVMCWKRSGCACRATQPAVSRDQSEESRRVITFAKMERTLRPAIRWARPGDMADLVRLCAEHAEYERSSFDPQGKEEALLRMLFAPEARLNCLVVEDDGVLAGYASCSVEVSTWDADSYMHMDCLF